jgi:dihydroorotate dehydrogenase
MASPAALDGAPAGDRARDLNVSCPNTEAGGLEFGADPALAAVVRQSRANTRRLVRQVANAGDIGDAARMPRTPARTGSPS